MIALKLPLTINNLSENGFAGIVVSDVDGLAASALLEAAVLFDGGNVLLGGVGVTAAARVLPSPEVGGAYQ